MITGDFKKSGEDKTYIVELESNVWLAPWSADPGRTTLRGNAKEFISKKSAKKALTNARKFRRFENAEISEVKDA